MKKAFIQDVGKILGGSAIAQIFSFLIIPLLARMYSPEDFAMLGLAFSFINFFAVLSCLRFEMAIISTKNEIDAIRIFYLCFFSIFFSFPVFSVILTLMSKFDILKFQHFKQADQILLILLTLLFSSFILIFRNLSIFFKQFTYVGVGGILQQSLGGIFQGLFGLLHADFISLIAGEFLARVVASLYFFGKLKDKLKLKFTRTDIFQTLKKNQKFAIYSTPSSFIENTSGNVIIPFLFYIFTPVEVGYYTLIQKLSAFPVSALSRAIADVFHERFSKLSGNHRHFFLVFAKYLVALSAIFCLGFFIFYKFIFAHVFQSQWHPATKIGLITIPWFGFQIAVGTLSRSLFIFQKQQLKFVYDCLLLVLTLAIFMITGYFHFDIYTFFLLQTISKSLLYIVYFFVIYRTVPKNGDAKQNT